jgi:hypothetical protein
MTTKISVKQTKNVDFTNAYTVKIETDYELETIEVHTNEAGEGLWINGNQTLGTCQFSAGTNPRENIRNYFVKYSM